MTSVTANIDGKQIKPRVLVSGHLPPPVGGIATYFLALLNSALPELVDLTFVQTSSQTRSLANSGSLTVRNMLSAILDCARFTSSLIRHRPQVIHISTAFGASFLKHSVCVWIARLAGCRVLLHPRCSITVLYVNRSRLWKWYFRLVVRQTSAVLALSKEWLQLKSILPSCTIYYLPNAIDQAPYREIAAEHLAQPEKHQPTRILYLGYVGKDKGSADLVEAAKILKADGEIVKIDIVGDELRPGEKEAIIQKVEQEDLEGWISVHAAAYGDEKLAYFRKADIFVYPSYHEGLPNAVLEAMASALPVVATKVGGIPDQVTDGINGLLVEPGRPDQLAGGLAKLAKDTALRNTMRSKSLEFAIEKFDMASYVPKLADIYKRTSKG